MSKHFSFSVVVAAALVATSAHAAPITTLFNTGVNAAGVALAHGTNPDPHYALISAPAALGLPTETLVITSAGGWPIGPYFVGGDASRWIVLNINPTAGQNTRYLAPQGDYIFRTTFDLTGFNYTTAAISGGWSTDNAGIDIKLNGVSKGGAHASNFDSGFSAFSLTSGFIAGINTIDFVVNNASGASGNPVALRVEMTGTANVPEPGALALVGMALFAAGLARRRSAR